MSDLTLAALVSFGIIAVFGVVVAANLILSGWFGRRDDE